MKYVPPFGAAISTRRFQPIMLAHKPKLRKDTRTKDQLKLATAKTLVRVLVKNLNELTTFEIDGEKHEDADLIALVGRANRWLERN